eukprot:1707752-Pleurochrysis_carterae.AAC.1
MAAILSEVTALSITFQMNSKYPQVTLPFRKRMFGEVPAATAPPPGCSSASASAPARKRTHAQRCDPQPDVERALRQAEK